jgi:hypothetical protein
MSHRRIRCLEETKKNIGVPVVVVTPKNLADFIVPEFPIHLAYEYLSLTHRSDYLRIYLLHVHGGGYCDIKEVYDSWVPWFEKTDLVTGFSGKEWGKVLGWSAFICRPRSAFTEEWYSHMNSFLDSKLDELKKNPAEHTKYDSYERPEYPIQWIELMGMTFEKTLPNYLDHVNDTLPFPNFSNYR